MSATARSVRARRGRVMIVGDVPELSSIVPQLQQPPIMAGNLFAALGEITIASAGAPIATVLLSDRCLSPESSRAIEALRKIDPSVRLVLIACPNANALSNEWVSKGLDDCIAAPIAPADLNRLFDEDMLATGNAASTEPSKPVEQTNRAASINEADDSSIEAPKAIALDDLRARLMPAEDLAAQAAAPPSTSRPGPAAIEIAQSTSSEVDSASNAPAAPTFVADVLPKRPFRAERSHQDKPSDQPSQPSALQRTAHGLGDTDLVEALLSPTGDIKKTALQLIIEQTGWNDISLIQDDSARQSEENSSACTVPVRFNKHSFGLLQTAAANADQLQPWADWLARWLALDHSHRDFRTKSLKDDLTGAWNRRFFDCFLKESIARARRKRRPVTVMVFDIDNFKPYNDNFGHEAGDEVLRETVRLLTSVIRQGDRVCRIGGDEFAVIFADPEGPRKPIAAGGGTHPETVEMIAKRFQDQICKMRFPKLGEQAPGNLSISAGLATYPWDGHEPAALLRHADQLALESKRNGKNAITFGPGAKKACQGDQSS